MLIEKEKKFFSLSLSLILSLFLSLCLSLSLTHTHTHTHTQEAGCEWNTKKSVLFFFKLNCDSLAETQVPI